MASNEITARFPTGDDARAAEVLLEREGIDGSAIHVERGRVLDQTRQTEVENEATKDVAGRWLGAGIAAGLFIGLISFGATFAITGDPTPGALVAGLCGAIVGFLLGGFYGAAGRLPANPESLATYERSDEPTLMTVRVDENLTEDQATAVRRIISEAGGR